MRTVVCMYCGLGLTIYSSSAAAVEDAARARSEHAEECPELTRMGAIKETRADMLRERYAAREEENE